MLTRRGLLKSASAGALTAALPRLGRTAPNDSDVIVIGAGFASGPAPTSATARIFLIHPY
jgi:hypothetical protein